MNPQVESTLTPTPQPGPDARVVVGNDSDDVVAQPARILYVNGWSSCHGGSSTSLIDIVTHIDRKRFDPLVLCPEPGALPDRLSELDIPVVLHSITSLTKKQCLRFACDTLWYYRFLKRNDIRLVHGNTGCSRRSVVAAAWLRGIPFIQHVRNVLKGVHDNFTYRYAARIISNSDYAGEPFKATSTYRDKTTTVYNAVDLSGYDSEDDRRDELEAGRRPIVGFVGHISSAKGVSTLIRAMSTVVDAMGNALLIIVGCGIDKEPHYESDCRELARKLDVERNVIFTGYRRDVPAWMRTFDVFVLPTQYETFGKVVVEAMAAGCPVVASRVGGIPEIVSDPSLGTLVPLDDPEALSQAILRYLKDKELARATADVARAHVRQQFGINTIIGQLESLYDEVLSESGRPHAE